MSEWWQNLCFTDRFMVVSLLVWLVVDIILGWLKRPTFSKRILAICKTHSAGLLIPLCLGIIIGHIFWPQYRKPVESPIQNIEIAEPNLPTELNLKDTENQIEVGSASAYMCFINEDGSMGAFQGGDYEYYAASKKYEEEHPESYLTGADLLFWQKLKGIEKKLDTVDVSDAEPNYSGSCVGEDITGEVFEANQVSHPTAYKPQIEWLGWPVYAVKYQGIDPGFYQGTPPPTQMIDKGVKLGLREDGVVVWREAEQ